MRKSFKLEDLDCANCAAKMQDAISKMPGVEKCTVNFMMQKMTLVADDARFNESSTRHRKPSTSSNPTATSSANSAGNEQPCPFQSSSLPRRRGGFWRLLKTI